MNEPGPATLLLRHAEVLAERWWNPGVVVIGEAAHAMDPESGVGAGLGFGDALQLARSIEVHPEDPDQACAHYERWRRPVPSTA